MTSVEGLWCFQTTSYDDPKTFRYGGVVVMETGRVLGGDSVMAYVGDYEVSGEELTVTIKSWQWNLALTDVENVFGMEGPIAPYIIKGALRREGEALVGHVSPEGDSTSQMQIRMLPMANLP